MNPLKNLIQRCHQRHKKPLRQRKTVLMPMLHDQDYPYHFKVYCANKKSVLLSDMEQANISFMPIGRAPYQDRGPRYLGGERFLKRQGIKDWIVRRWHLSWGIQVYTGIPSEQDGARWHDFEFTYQAICTAPDAIFACIEALVNTVENPLLTITKSGGLRFSCRVPNYLHPDAETERLYIYKHTPTPENPHQREIYLEILGEERCSRWDARYEIILGNILEPPVIGKEILFAPIEALRSKLHIPDLSIPTKPKKPIIRVPLSLGSHPLDLAKEAFLKRGFSYVRKDDNIYYWTSDTSKVEDGDVSLWEHDGTVWIRASTANIGLPTEATRITDIWNDTGIFSPISAAGTPVSETVIAIRKEELSPLAIKRPPSTLHKSEQTKKVYKTFAENSKHIKDYFDRTDRILVLTSETTKKNNFEIGSYVLKGGTVCLCLPYISLAKKAEQEFLNQNILSSVRWKPRRYLWNKVQEIPISVRMENPFERGNICEDVDRCEALEKKGGDPNEIICPHCPVYTECQQRGYLSQFATLQHAKAQITATPQLFFNPEHAETLEEILGPENGTERLCIFNEVQAYKLFVKCELSKTVIEEWVENWEGDVLGNFAKALLNALSIKDRSHGGIVKRVRTAMQTFEWQEETLVQQMCQVNVEDKVPVDKETSNEDMETSMSMAQAVELEILDTESVDKIDKFPTVCRNPNWTFWHQLKHFFASYMRDADTPMLWDDEVLHFTVPPVLHERVKRFLLMSTNLSDQNLRRAFPDENIAVLRIEPSAWIPGNQVFQIRSGDYSVQTILDYENNWDVFGMSKVGLQLFGRILAEIERDPNVKHAIITYRPLSQHLAHIAKKENVCFVADFKRTKRFKSLFEEADVVWIVGTPNWAPGVIWHRAQILHGNDKEPLSYEEDPESGRYKDERVQNVYEQDVIGLLTQIVGRVALNRMTGKKVLLITKTMLPDITDRPETLLFDWEDFEVAGRLDKLAETIITRQRFEAEQANLTAETSRQEVEWILGCSSRQANRVLNKLRGGNIQRVPFREQILSLLADGEKKASELAASIDGNPKSINNELKRLVDIGEIIKVRWGVYALPET